MTQIRPRLDEEDLIAEIQAYADRYGQEVGVRISFNAAVKILLRHGLAYARRTTDQQQDAGSKP